MEKSEMKPTDVTSLCTAGEIAWSKIGPKSAQAKFTWRGKRYVAQHSGFRLTVDDEAGNPIACKWD